MCAMRSPRTTTWPTKASRRRSSSRCACTGRCCSKARRASARPRSPRCSRAGPGGELIRLQCYEGIDVAQAVYEWDYARQLLHLRAAEAAGKVGPDATTDGSRTSSTPSGSSCAGRCCKRSTTARGRRRPAHRRGRPRRRRVRGVPARGALGLRDHGARARHVPRRRAADRRDHVEPHTRRARRAQAPLPLPLGRPSGLRARGRDRPAARAGRVRALARQVAAAVEPIRGLGLYKPPGVAETIDWAMALAVLGRRRSTSASVRATLGTVLKYREDAERVQTHGIGDLVRAAALARDIDAGHRRRRALSRSASPVLRGAGLDVPVGTVVTYRGALAAVGIDGRSGVYWAGRTTLVRRSRTSALRPRVPRVVARWRDDGTSDRDAAPTRSRSLLDDEDGPTRSRSPTGDEPTSASHHGALQPARDPAPQGLRPVRPTTSSTRPVGSWPTCASRARCGRRAAYRRSHRARGRPDLRRTVRSALRVRRRALRRRGSSTTSVRAVSCCCST